MSPGITEADLERIRYVAKLPSYRRRPEMLSPEWGVPDDEV